MSQSHLILNRNAGMVVLNSAADPRFADGPLCSNQLQPHLRISFFAGFPVLSENGFPIGVLSVYDSEPRSDWKSGEQRFLKSMAQELSKEMDSIIETEYALREAKLQNSESLKDELFRFLLSIAELLMDLFFSLFHSDLDSGFSVFSRALNRFESSSTFSIGSDLARYGMTRSTTSNSNSTSSVKFSNSLADEVAVADEAEIEECSDEVETEDSSIYGSSFNNSSISEDQSQRRVIQPICDLAVKTVAAALDLPVAYLAERDSRSLNSAFQMISSYGLEGKIDDFKLDLASHNTISPSVFQDVRVNHLLKEKDVLPWWTSPSSFHGGALVPCQSLRSIDSEKTVYTLVVLTPNPRRVISSFGESHTLALC